MSSQYLLKYWISLFYTAVFCYPLYTNRVWETNWLIILNKVSIQFFEKDNKHLDWNEYYFIQLIFFFTSYEELID